MDVQKEGKNKEAHGVENQENRKAKRISTHLKLKMEPFETGGEPVEADVLNLSKGGLGFETKVPLPDNMFFKANLVLESKDSMETVIETIRHGETIDGRIQYGGRFVGLSESDQFKIEVFRLFAENEHQEES